MSARKTRDEGFALVFGANLARCRRELGVSQEEPGFRAGLHRTAVGQIERGERVARTDTLVRLCDSLEVGPDALLAGLRWHPPRLAAGQLEIESTKATQPKKEKAATREPKEKPTKDSEAKK